MRRPQLFRITNIVNKVLVRDLHSISIRVVQENQVGSGFGRGSIEIDRTDISTAFGGRTGRRILLQDRMQGFPKGALSLRKRDLEGRAGDHGRCR